MTDFIFVEDSKLILAELNGIDRLGVDTEFLREKTFLSQLCLIQLSTAEQKYCVDPLAGANMDAFWEAAFKPLWVVHSGRQDIEVVYQTAGGMPDAIFDTQVAAALLGYMPQMGYASLVEEFFDVVLPKTHTRADWSQRPLPLALLEYAAEDVEYLLRAHDLLSERLDKLGRLEWAQQDSAHLLSPALYDINPADAISRLKGARNLRGARRTSAARLAEWRESEALKRNRPRQWIIKDSVLIDIACQQPGSLSQLKSIDSVPEKLVDRVGRQLLDQLQEPSDGDSSYQPPRPPSEQQKALLKDLQRMVSECAEELGVASEIIASKKELTAAVLFEEFSSRVFRDWRRELIGEQLIARVSG